MTGEYEAPPPPYTPDDPERPSVSTRPETVHHLQTRRSNAENQQIRPEHALGEDGALQRVSALQPSKQRAARQGSLLRDPLYPSLQIDATDISFVPRSWQIGSANIVGPNITTFTNHPSADPPESRPSSPQPDHLALNVSPTANATLHHPQRPTCPASDHSRRHNKGCSAHRRRRGQNTSAPDLLLANDEPRLSRFNPTTLSESLKELTLTQTNTNCSRSLQDIKAAVTSSTSTAPLSKPTRLALKSELKALKLDIRDTVRQVKVERIEEIKGQQQQQHRVGEGEDARGKRRGKGGCGKQMHWKEKRELRRWRREGLREVRGVERVVRRAGREARRLARRGGECA